MKDALSTAARNALHALALIGDDEAGACTLRAEVHQATWRTLKVRGLVVERRPKVPELTDPARAFLKHEEAAVSLGVDIADAARSWHAGAPELLALAFDAAWETL